MCAAGQCPDEKAGPVMAVVYVFENLPHPASTPIMPNATTHDLDLDWAAGAEGEERAEMKEREMLGTIPLDIPHYRHLLSKKKMVLQRARHVLHVDSFKKPDGGGREEGGESRGEGRMERFFSRRLRPSACFFQGLPTLGVGNRRSTG